MIKKSNTEKIILGIDPGTNVMGYGVIRIIGNKAELVVMGVIDMRKESDPYLRLGKIFDRVTGIIDSYLPDEMAIEAPFFGKNVQSMLKLGRAQGVASQRHSSQRSYPRICAAQNQDGHYRTGTGFEGTGGGNAAATAPYSARRNAEVHGRYRCTGGSLLPLSADEPPGDRRQALQQLERLCNKESE